MPQLSPIGYIYLLMVIIVSVVGVSILWLDKKDSRARKLASTE